MNSTKSIWLRILCRWFYVGSLLLVALFFYLGITGNRPGTDWQGELLFYALQLVFFGLLGDVVCDIEERQRRK